MIELKIIKFVEKSTRHITLAGTSERFDSRTAICFRIRLASYIRVYKTAV